MCKLVMGSHQLCTKPQRLPLTLRLRPNFIYLSDLSLGRLMCMGLQHEVQEQTKR